MRATAPSDELCEEHGWFNCNQFHNKWNIESHYMTTGVELLDWAKKENKSISAVVTGTGTGGTLMGCHKRLKPEFPTLKMVAVEPEESAVMSGGEPGVHGIQGIGDGSKFLVNMDCVDYISIVSTEDAKARAREWAKSHGLFVCISAGANILAAERFIEERKPKGIVVTFLCDRGDRYFSCL